MMASATRKIPLIVFIAFILSTPLLAIVLIALELNEGLVGRRSEKRNHATAPSESWPKYDLESALSIDRGYANEIASTDHCYCTIKHRNEKSTAPGVSHQVTAATDQPGTPGVIWLAP